MRRTFILIILLSITSLALTPTPTIEPVPTSHPGVAVKTADGGSVFVEDGRVYKVDASGARTETELSREVFTDVFEAGDMVKQLHPEYFGEDQSALKDELMPEGTAVDMSLKRLIESNIGTTDTVKRMNLRELVAKAVEITEVKNNERVKLVAYLSAYGSKEPIALPLAYINQSGEVLFLGKNVKLQSRGKIQGVGSVTRLGPDFIGSTRADLVNYFFGKVMISEIVVRANDPDLYKKSEIFQLGLDDNETSEILSSEQIVHGAYTEYKQQKIKSSTTGQAVEQIYDLVRKNPHEGFSGFFPNNLIVLDD